MSITSRKITLNLVRLRRKLTWQLMLAGIITVSVFGFLFARAWVGFQELRGTSLTLEPRFLVFSFATYLAGALLAATLWSHILRTLSGRSEWAYDVQVFGVSILARKAPGFVWEALSRLALYERRGVQRSVIVAAMAAEVSHRSLAGGVVFALALLAGEGNSQWFDAYVSFPVTLFWFLLVAAIIAVILSAPWMHKWLLKRMRQAPQGEQDLGPPELLSRRVMLIWIGGYVCVLVFSGAYLHLFMQAFGDVASASFWTVFGAFGLVVAVAPLSMWLPGDIGVRDGLLYLALSTAVPGSFAAVLVLAIRVWSTLSELCFGAVCGVLLGKRTIGSIWRSSMQTSIPEPPGGDRPGRIEEGTGL